jgi:hypothetical protein
VKQAIVPHPAFAVIIHFEWRQIFPLMLLVMMMMMMMMTIVTVSQTYLRLSVPGQSL